MHAMVVRLIVVSNKGKALIQGFDLILDYIVKKKKKKLQSEDCNNDQEPEVHHIMYF